MTSSIWGWEGALIKSIKINLNQHLLLGLCIHPFFHHYISLFTAHRRGKIYIYVYFFYFRRDAASKTMCSFLFGFKSSISRLEDGTHAPKEKRYLGNVSERHCSIMALFCDWLAWRWRSWRLTITRGISDKSLFMYHHFITSISCLESLSHLLSFSFFSPLLVSSVAQSTSSHSLPLQEPGACYTNRLQSNCQCNDAAVRSSHLPN